MLGSRRPCGWDVCGRRQPKVLSSPSQASTSGSKARARNDCLPAWVTAVISWRSTMGGRWVALGWVGGVARAQNRSNRALNSRSKGFQAEAPSIISPLRPLAGELCLWMIPQRAQSQLFLWQGSTVGSSRNETSKGRRGEKERTRHEQSAGQLCLSNRLGEGGSLGCQSSLCIVFSFAGAA
jgi:hypothetical protein